MKKIKDNEKMYRDWKVLYKKMNPACLALSFRKNLEYALSKDQYSATPNDKFWAFALAVRDRVIERWILTQQKYHKENVKRVYYLSLEFLIGRLLGNYIYNLGVEKSSAIALNNLGIDFDALREEENDAGLGNGGLGRLAACFLDSMATLQVPAHGYGIRYDYGIFKQKIKDGYQVELPDEWLRHGSPWEFARPEYLVKVQFYGHTNMHRDKTGALHIDWVDTQDVFAVPYDIPIPGYKNDVVNTLRLWSARGTEEFDFEYFNEGDYGQAVHNKIVSENISKVLYPNDDISQGRELRLKQQYFFVAASIADIIRRFKSENDDLRSLPEKVCIQLNDTHPSLAIPELMRVLMDMHGFGWEEAWNIVIRTFCYTNHTLMPEALERWSVKMFGSILPRHLQIIYEINGRFLDEVSKRFPGDVSRLRKMSIIMEGEPKKIRMAHLAIVGSFSVNGVSDLHTELLKTEHFRDFHEFFPGKFNNKTNGITQRRWLLKANPGLSGLITGAIGDSWTTNFEAIKEIEKYKDDPGFIEQWKQAKQKNKENLAEIIKNLTGITPNAESLFDVQVKRIHEYKRQVLFGLYIISRYLEAKNNPAEFICPRTFIIGGKAAPGYFAAKLSIKFITSIADRINSDKSVSEKIKVVFLENYRVSLAEKIFPASDLSEQISLAGTEASGTGNMKFMINGALTIGTLDGATIEMAQALGKENIFLFGLNAREAGQLKASGYTPEEYIAKSGMLTEIIHLLENNFFCPYNPGLFDPIVNTLKRSDPFMACADFDSYLQKQKEASIQFRDKNEWAKKSIINVSRSGRFSSDRTIRQYAGDIWKVSVK